MTSKGSQGEATFDPVKGNWGEKGYTFYERKTKNSLIFHLDLQVREVVIYIL